MNKHKNKYNERTIRWQDKSRSQLSYVNDLVLTLSIAFLSFGYDYDIFSETSSVFQGISINVKSIVVALISIECDVTLIKFSFIFSGLSVFFGFLTIIYRLYDFRLTSQINLVRFRAWKHSEAKLDESTPDKYNCLRRFTLTFKVLSEKYPKITIEECKNFGLNPEDSTLKHSFRELRNIVHNLGVGTWSMIKFQIISFAFSILLFVVAQLIK